MTNGQGAPSWPDMSNKLEHARQRGLRAALAAAGGKVREALPAITVTSAALISAVAATGCIPKWGPSAPPKFARKAGA